MRLKDPFSLKAAEMTKRTNKPRKPRDEESSDEVSGKLNLVSFVEFLLKIHTFFKENQPLIILFINRTFYWFSGKSYHFYTLSPKE